MTVKEQISVFDNSVRLQILKGEEEIYLGYLGNLHHHEGVEELLTAEVKRFKAIPDIKHKKWKDKHLMPPIEPDKLPQYSFSDLQMSLYYTIYI